MILSICSVVNNTKRVKHRFWKHSRFKIQASVIATQEEVRHRRTIFARRCLLLFALAFIIFESSLDVPIQYCVGQGNEYSSSVTFTVSHSKIHVEQVASFEDLESYRRYLDIISIRYHKTVMMLQESLLEYDGYIEDFRINEDPNRLRVSLEYDIHGLVKGVLIYSINFNFIQDIYGVRRSLASFDRKSFNVLSYRNLTVLVEGFPIQISDNEMQFVPFWLVAVTAISLGSFIILAMIVLRRSRHVAGNSGAVRYHADYIRDYVSLLLTFSMVCVIHLTFSNS